MHRLMGKTGLAAALIAAGGLALSACTSLHEYARRAAGDACRSAGTCTVYDDTGRHLEPCWATPEGDMAYPGDAQWPFEKGVCDAAPAGAPEPDWWHWE